MCTNEKILEVGWLQQELDRKEKDPFSVVI